MLDVRYWLLGFFLLTACVRSDGAVRSVSETGTVVKLDFLGERASAPGWEVKMVNCSTESYRCYELPGRMVLAFPKSCDAFKVRIRDLQLPRRYSVVGMDPHRNLPDGSYVSAEYPSILLFYKSPLGFVEARRLATTPSAVDFDPNKYEERFVFKNADGGAVLPCA